MTALTRRIRDHRCDVAGLDADALGALGRDMKGKSSPFLYAAAIPLAFLNRWMAVGMYVLVALAIEGSEKVISPDDVRQGGCRHEGMVAR